MKHSDEEYTEHSQEHYRRVLESYGSIDIITHGGLNCDKKQIYVARLTNRTGAGSCSSLGGNKEMATRNLYRSVALMIVNYIEYVESCK